MTRLVDLPKTSSFTKRITADPRIPTVEAALENADNIIHTPRVIPKGGFSYSLPEKRPEYLYLTSSANGLRDLGLPESDTQDAVFQQIVSGRDYQQFVVEEKYGFPMPYSQTYAGWQFGQFAGQLGDGRVVNLFELEKAKEVNDSQANQLLPQRQKYEVQLKGSGKTPYSRFADGKAVIRSSIREYVILEHLHALGIPSTRALSLTLLPKTWAQRHRAEKCAVVARFAESWIRLGSFDLYRWRGDREGVRALSDYVISELFEDKFEKFEEITAVGGSKYLESYWNDLGKELTSYDKMYFEAVIRNAITCLCWQVYGFLNGVLNTDNTSIVGLSMDFGPFSIMDKFDPNYTPNSEDHELRYGYRNTPTAIWWNLTRLGEDLAELIGAGRLILEDPMFKKSLLPEWEDPIIKRATKIIEIGGNLFRFAFTRNYVDLFFKRLGLSSSLINASNPDEQNDALIQPLLDLLYKIEVDFNKFFVLLQKFSLEDLTNDRDSVVQAILNGRIDNIEEARKYSDDELSKLVNEWLDIYVEYLKKNPLEFNKNAVQAKLNPVFLPRNWIFDQVVAQVEDSKGEDLSYLKKLEKMAFNPYDSSKWGDELKEKELEWISAQSSDKLMLQCSCAS